MQRYRFGQQQKSTTCPLKSIPRFRDITRAIIEDTNETLSVAAPVRFAEIAEPVHVGVPTRIGRTIGISLYQSLTETEKNSILEAAKAIYQTYLLAVEGLETPK